MSARLAIVGCLAVVATATASPRADLISYDLPARLTLHEPVVLTLSVVNVLSEPIRIEYGRDYVQHMAFDVDGSQASVVPTWPAEVEEMFGIAGDDLVAGAKRVHQILLNRWIDFSRAGSYSITAHFNGPIETARGTPVVANRQATFHLTILPRDEATLRRTCESLAHEASTDETVEHWQYEIAALGYTGETIAVPLLVKIPAANVMTAVSVVDAPVRIGGPEARQALETLVATADPRTASLAKSALNYIK